MEQASRGRARRRTQLWKDLSLPFYGYNRPGAKVSESIREQFVHQSMMAGFPAPYMGITAWSETNVTEDLNKFNVPTLIIHGDDDHIVAIANSALRSAKIIPNATRKIYEVYLHGIATIHKDRINQDLLAFIKGRIKPFKLACKVPPRTSLMSHRSSRPSLPC